MYKGLKGICVIRLRTLSFALSAYHSRSKCRIAAARSRPRSPRGPTSSSRTARRTRASGPSSTARRAFPASASTAARRATRSSKARCRSGFRSSRGTRKPRWCAGPSWMDTLLNQGRLPGAGCWHCISRRACDARARRGGRRTRASLVSLAWQLPVLLRLHRAGRKVVYKTLQNRNRFRFRYLS